MVDPSAPVIYSITQGVASLTLQTPRSSFSPTLFLTSHPESRDAAVEEIIYAFKI